MPDKMITIYTDLKNFGAIKNMFNTILVEGVVGKDKFKKKVFKQYVDTINENKILKTQFLVYSNLETKVEPDEFKATQFVKENIELFSKYKKQDILDANAKLAALLTESIGSYNESELHSNIGKLIFTKKSPQTIDTIIESTSNIVKYIMNNKPRVITESIELPTVMLTTAMVSKYNEKYADLDESERQVLKVLIESDDEKKKAVYGDTLKECIGLINEKLGDADLEGKEKLLKVKEKLLNDNQEMNEDFIKNISKLVELRSNLKNN